MDDEVLVAAGHRYRYEERTAEDLLKPLPPPPEFAETIDELRARIAKIVGTLKVPHQVRYWHYTIDRLLKEDDRRRLRLLNALFLTTSKMNAKPSIDFQEGLRVHFAFFWQHFWVKLDRARQSSRRKMGAPAAALPEDDFLMLSILKGSNSESVRIGWQDDEVKKLESKLEEIAVELIVTAEAMYREHALFQYEWGVKRKAELEEAERQREIALERAEKERKQRIEQARVDRLLKDAAMFQQAKQIRSYVLAVHSELNGRGELIEEEVERWSQWALAQADRLDPSLVSRFLESDYRDDKLTQT